MDTEVTVWIFIIACILPSTLQNSSVAFSAPSRLNAGSTLVLHCRPNPKEDRFGFIHAYEFTIERRNEDAEPLVRISIGRNGEQDIKWGDELVQERGRIQGSLGFPNVSFARVQISEADCTDDAEYTCAILDENNEEPTQRSRHVTIIQNPIGVFPITATSVQREEMSNNNLGIISAALQNAGSTQSGGLPIGSITIFNCTARESFPPPTIRWCIRRQTEGAFSNFAFASVQRLDMVNASFPRRSCFFTKTSLLPFTITAEDNGTSLSCSTDTTECPITARSSTVSIYVIVTTDTENSAGGSNEDDLAEVIVADSHSSRIGITALVTAGIVLIIIGGCGTALAIFTYTKARKIKIEYETLKERERYQTLNEMSGGTDPVTYETLGHKDPEDSVNYVNADYRVYSEVGHRSSGPTINSYT
ncbi:uncharacterized protein LOC133173251 [Saccostrea echinata]|uniref:uncharacterized protein LOC133173251 n=1 Tax=Saccostrea echinata TaxID=191078 RepID=UPI002A823950|nr:uncharacterized protein LOC133173251 [Saccostrea echinata]